MQLVITEKPSVARAIATALSAKEGKDGYIEGNGYIISWCVGHLIELAQPERYQESWKKWSYDELPMIPGKWKHEVKKETYAQYKVLKNLMQDERVNGVINACDAGREGELIFRLVYDQAGCRKPMQRLWISSMEESAIRAGFQSLRPGAEYDTLYASALCRQEADWLVGLNGTRLFTVLYGGKTLKVGRVQTPTLAMLVDREAGIMNFKKEQYFMTHIMCDGVDAVTERIEQRSRADSIADSCMESDAIVTAVTRENKSVAPPKLYDLTTLQREANRIFGFTAKQTLEYTQSLYEAKLVTYPRTDSQYLSDDMEDTAANVLAVVREKLPFIGEPTGAISIKRVLNSKKVTDHHAIIPTMELVKADLQTIPEGEKKILFLTANRLLCATGEKHIYEVVKAEISCNDTGFRVSGKSVKVLGWKAYEDRLKAFYKASGKDTEDSDETECSLPDLCQNMVLHQVQTRVTEHFTSPPKHFTEDTILSAMERAGAEDMGDDVERKGLGTPATRADIIEKLVRDGFVKREKKQMIPTDDGIKLITVLPELVKSPKLTSDWENALSLVAKGEYTAEEFMSGIADLVKNLVSNYSAISDENKQMFQNPSEIAPLGTCPKCGGSVLKGKYGAYCKNKCGMSLSKAMGVKLSDSQVRSLLDWKKILMKGLKGKNGKEYDAYLIPDGVEDYTYTKDGKETTITQYHFKMEFPEHKTKKKGA